MSDTPSPVGPAVITCIHCGDRHPSDWSHCPRTGRPLGTGTALLGRVIAGRYRIVGMIGEGGMGAVYAAEHLLLEKRVALKRLHPDLASDSQAIARFQREARAAAATGHEHIVDVLDMGFAEDGAPFLVMEYLQGESLAAVLGREARLAPSRACHVVGQVLAALEMVHEKGIVHRDLKPDNVFLTRRAGRADYVKLLDFGVSKMRDAEGDAGPLTRTGVMMGTPHYMSPEQARGMRSHDHRVDLYAVGVILYQSIAGALPFDGPNYHALLQAILAGMPRPIEAIVPTLPGALAKLVQKAIARDPDERFQTAREMLEALLPHGAVVERSAGAGEGLVGSGVPPGEPPGPWPSGTVAADPSAALRRAVGAPARPENLAPTRIAEPVPVFPEAATRPAAPPPAPADVPRAAATATATAEPLSRPRAAAPARPFTASSSDWSMDVVRRLRARPIGLGPIAAAAPLHSTPDPMALPLARPSASGIQAGTQVKGTFLLAVLDHLRESFGDRDLTRVKKRLSAETAERVGGVVLPVGWIPQRAFDEVLEAADAELGTGNGDIARELGRAFASRDVPTTYRLLMIGSTPTAAVQRFPTLWQACHDAGSLTVAPLDGGGWSVEIRDHLPDSHAHALAMAGFFGRVVELAGGRDVRVTVVSSRAKGDERTLLHVRWR